MTRSLMEIQAERREVLARAETTKDEIKTLMDRHDGGDKSPGLTERLDRTKRAADKILTRVAELDEEARMALKAGVESGSFSLEGGSDGGVIAGAKAYGAGIVDQARRRVDGLVKGRTLPEHGATNVERLLIEAKGRDQDLAARWVLAAGSDAYMGAFAKLLGDPERGHMLWTAGEQKAYQTVTGVQAELKAMSLTSAVGGYMVPLSLDPAIILTSDGSVNPLRQIARVVQTVTDAWSGVTSAGVTAEWLDEAEEASDASPTLAQPRVPVHKGSAFVPYSYEIGMDAVGFASEVGKLLTDAADQLQAAAYMNGSGTGEPTGLTTALPTGSRVAATTADTIVAADFVNVQNQLAPRWQPRAQWLANLATINAAAAFETGNGALRFPEIGSGQLLRKPLNEASGLETAGAGATAGNDLVAVYGDFQQFLIVDRIGTTVELIPNLFGANRRPTGQRGLFLWFRTGSDVLVDNAFRMLTA